jgi:hypothetical protein
MRRRLTVMLLIGTIALSSLVEASVAAAGYDPVASGSTTLTLAASFRSLLRANGVRLQGAGGVTVKGSVVSFPVSGGKLEPVGARGVVEHQGSLIFEAGSRRVPLRALQLKTTRKSAPYAAKLGGGQLKLATTRALKDERLGFGSRFRTANLLLTTNVAERLDKKLDLGEAFATGAKKLGTATTTVDPASVDIAAGGKAELTIDPAFASKLQSLFVAVNPIAPAEHPGAFTFPIAGGTLALGPGIPASGLKTEGALEFIQVGGGQFFARQLEIDLSDQVANGESQLALAASGPGPNQSGSIFGVGTVGIVTSTNRTIAVTGAPLTLEPTTAQAFNEAFAKPIGKADVFAAGETLGTISFTAQAQ